MKTENEIKEIIEKVEKMPYMSIQYCNDSQIGILCRYASLRGAKMDEIQKNLGLRDLYVTFCPAEGYNPKGIVLVGEF